MARLTADADLPLGADGAPVEIEVSETRVVPSRRALPQPRVFAALASLRKRLNTPATFATAAAEVQGWGKRAGTRASSARRAGRGRAARRHRAARRSTTLRASPVGRPSRRGPTTRSTPAAQRASGPFVRAGAPARTRMRWSAAVDEALSDAMRAVLHHPDFQNAESLWRGVDFLLRRLETSHQLQVHLIDLSAEELAADLSAVADLVGKRPLQAARREAVAGRRRRLHLHLRLLPASTPRRRMPTCSAARRWSPRTPARRCITAINTDPFTDRKEPPHRLVREAFAALRRCPTRPSSA